MDLDTESRMLKAIENLDNKLLGIRAGRANPSMLNGIMVEYYGNPTPLNSIANITVPEARQLFIKPFDRSALKEIEKAINLGEEAKVALRNIRQEDNDKIKKAELPEDEEKLYLDDVQELINKYNKIVDDKVNEKENELMKI